MQREREVSSNHWFTHKWPQSGLGHVGARSQELHLDLPCGWKEPKYLDHLPVPFPGALAGSWIRNGAARTWTGTPIWDQMWWLILIYHHVSPIFSFFKCYYLQYEGLQFLYSAIFPYFAVSICTFGFACKNPLSNSVAWKFSPTFSSKNYIILAFTFRSTIYSELIQKIYLFI